MTFSTYTSIISCIHTQAHYFPEPLDSSTVHVKVRSHHCSNALVSHRGRFQFHMEETMEQRDLWVSQNMSQKPTFIFNRCWFNIIVNVNPLRAPAAHAKEANQDHHTHFSYGRMDILRKRAYGKSTVAQQRNRVVHSSKN